MSQVFEVRLEDALKKAWGLFVKSPEVFLTISVVALGGSIFLGALPLLGFISTLVTVTLAPAAFFLAAEECSRTGIATFDSLRRLGPLFPQLLALFVVKTIILSLGFTCLILPGIYAWVTLLFAELFVVLEGKNFWDAIVASHRLVQGNWFRTFGLACFLAILAASGLVLVGIGVMLTMPFAALVLFSVFYRIRPAVVVA
ncbi:MAG: hypothetical protein ACXVB9_00230 [Bdellovibrionota bacterium]